MGRESAEVTGSFTEGFGSGVRGLRVQGWWVGDGDGVEVIESRGLGLMSLLVVQVLASRCV
jgi:hypothetical protein